MAIATVCFLLSIVHTRAETLAVLQAMNAEMQRSVEVLGKQSPSMYFLSYAVAEITTTSMVASFGALESRNVVSRRVLDVDLRVGSYDIDNTRSIRGVAFEMGRGTRGVLLPSGDNVVALQSIMWSATDKAYKAAIERYGKVVTNRQVKVKEEDTSADLSREQNYKYIQPLTEWKFDTTAWQQLIVRISGRFAAKEHVVQGKVTFQADYLVKYFVNNEGTEIRTVEPIVKMFLLCKSKAADGMSLPLYRSYSAYSVSALPSEAQLVADADAMIQQCIDLRNAPLTETFTGPAILSGRSSGVFFHEIFGHRVEGHRQKDVNSSQTFKTFVDKKILPEFISVVFDPTITTYGGTDVVGAYAYDDEGMPAQRVVAVENGIFRRFLMSRSPIEGFPHSNGHGRHQPGFKCVSRQSNLLVQTSVSVPYDSLRAMLRNECVKQKKEYGLFFQDIQGGFTFTGRTVPNAFNVQPLVVYRVYADGRPDQLVRGVDLIGTPLTTFNNILAAANDTGIFNGVCGAESGGVPVSACSPSILVSTIEVQKKQKSQAKPPILSDPTISTSGTP
jgi:TldD protein